MEDINDMILDIDDIVYTSDMTPEQLEENSQQNEQYHDKDVDPEQSLGSTDTEKEETSITISDLTDILRIVTNNDSKEEEAAQEEVIQEEDIQEEVSQEENVNGVNQNEINTYDYTELLQSIENEISSGNAINQETQDIIVGYTESNSCSTNLDSISINTLLLILIFSSLLVNILIKLIRGLF